MSAPAVRAAFVLPAAGRGRRMGASTLKPFLPLAGRPILVHVLERVAEAGVADEAVVVVPEADRAWLERTYGAALRAAGMTALVSGGPRRQDSVARGLAALCGDAPLVAIHDAVRPFASAALIRAVCAAAATADGAVPVIPVVDTLKRVRDGRVQGTVDRDGLYGVQTPQVFGRARIEHLYARAEELDARATDDARLAEAAGLALRAVPGEPYNLKITTPQDLRLAEALLAAGLVPAHAESSP